MLILKIASAILTLIIMVSKLNVLSHFKNITQAVFWRFFSPPDGAGYYNWCCKNLSLKNYPYKYIYRLIFGPSQEMVAVIWNYFYWNYSVSLFWELWFETRLLISKLKFEFQNSDLAKIWWVVKRADNYIGQ